MDSANSNEGERSRPRTATEVFIAYLVVMRILGKEF
jgi:hypothetical protein